MIYLETDRSQSEMEGRGSIGWSCTTKYDSIVIASPHWSASHPQLQPQHSLPMPQSFYEPVPSPYPGFQTAQFITAINLILTDSIHQWSNPLLSFGEPPSGILLAGVYSCMCIDVAVSIHVSVSLHVCVHLGVYVDLCVCGHISMWSVCLYVLCVSLCISMWACVSVSTRVCSWRTMM